MFPQGRHALANTGAALAEQKQESTSPRRTREKTIISESSQPSNELNMSKKPVKGEYIETVTASCHCDRTVSAQNLTCHQDTGNKVSRRSQIIGTTNIILGGKTVIQAEVIIRGDLLRTLPPSNGEERAKQAGNPVAVAIGRYCFFSRGCVLRPPGKMYRG